MGETGPPELRFYSIPQNWMDFAGEEQRLVMNGICGVLQQVVRAKSEHDAEVAEYEERAAAGEDVRRVDPDGAINRIMRAWQVGQIKDWQVELAQTGLGDPSANVYAMAIHIPDGGDYVVMAYPMLCFTESDMMQHTADAVSQLRNRV